MIILVLGWKYKSRSFSLHIFLQSPVSSFFLGTNSLKHVYVLCLSLVSTYLPYSKWNESSPNPPKPTGFSNPSHVVVLWSHTKPVYMEVLHSFKKIMCEHSNLSYYFWISHLFPNKHGQCFASFFFFFTML